MHERRSSNREPTVKPGQIWLIELPGAAALCAVDRQALTSAKVVLYDRALEALVAELLPIGHYAEALPADVPLAGSAISARALRFAEDGWSVVQISAARPGRRERVEDAAARLRRPGGAAELPVVVIAKGAAGGPCCEPATLRSLPELDGGFDETNPPTLVFGPLAVAYPTPAEAFTANGLAG